MYKVLLSIFTLCFVAILNTFSSQQLYLAYKGGYQVDGSFDEDSSCYVLKTQGICPSVFMYVLDEDLKGDGLYLHFDYLYNDSRFVGMFAMSFQDENGNEIIYHTIGRLTNSDEWQEYKYNLQPLMRYYPWGRKGDKIKLFIGSRSGVTFKIKNICVKGKDEPDTLRFNYITSEKIRETGLPLLSIETVDNEMPDVKIVKAPKDSAWGETISSASKVGGRVRLYDNGDYSVPVYDSGEYEDKKSSGVSFRIRGNSTAAMQKTPYKITLNKSADLFMRGDDYKYADKDWILLVDDNLYSFFGLKLSSLLGMEWTPAFRYVNLEINGQYFGVYMLIESVKRNCRSRINVSTYGYLYELDAYWWASPYYVRSEMFNDLKMHYTVKYPDYEDMNNRQKLGFETLLHDFERSVKDGRYSDMIDAGSFALWLLAHDIYGSADRAGTNVYFAKYDDLPTSKIRMPLLWDYDSAMRCGINEWSRHHTATFSFFFENEDKSFVEEYVRKWDSVKDSVFSQMLIYLDSVSVSSELEPLRLSMNYNRLVWGTQNKKEFNDCVGDAVAWFSCRKEVLDNLISPLAQSVTARVEKSDDNLFSAYSFGRNIFVNKRESDVISVCDSMGRLVYSGFDNIVKVEMSGIYYIRVQGITRAVMVW